MVCKNCGTSYGDGMQFCPNCGTPAAQPYDYGYQSAPNPAYQAPNPATNPYAGYEKPVSIGQYIGWTLLAYVFGPISLILTIVFACMGDRKSRANFFRAQLVVWGILIAISILAIIVLSVIGISLIGLADDLLYDSYYYYDDFLSLAMRAVNFIAI